MRQAQPILVIDDDDSIRELVEMALRNEGYDVLTAQHGRAPLRILGQSRPVLILLDMRMPVMDGWEFARNWPSSSHRAPRCFAAPRVVRAGNAV